MKILFLDIERAPVIATTWSLFPKYLSPDMMLGDSYVLSWAAKWHESDDVEYSSLGMASHEDMITSAYELMEEADAIVTYNGDKFDFKVLNQEFLMLGLPPPKPFASIDLLKTVRRRFAGTSNKLSYWLKKLNLGDKVAHRGHQLWLDCMNGDKDAFAEMEDYNIGDVVELEKLYDRLLPWIVNHPNHGVYEEGLCCPTCASTSFHWEGWRKTKTRKYRRAQCNDCGQWFSSNKSEPTTGELAVAIN